MVDIRLDEIVNLGYTIISMIILGGILLLGAMAMLAYQMTQRIGLNKFRSKNPGFADLLNWAAEPADGVVVCKNGALMACFMYIGRDDAMLTDDECNLISNQLNQMFGPMDSGMVLHIDAIRRPLPAYFNPKDSFFPTKVAAAIDQDRRNYFEGQDTMYDSTFVMTVTWLPPLVSVKKISDKMYTSDGEVEMSDKEKTEDLLKTFEEKLVNIRSQLENVFKNVYRLRSYSEVDEHGRRITYDNLLTWLNFCLTGEWHKIILPSTPIYLDNYLAQDFQSGIVPVLGNKYIKVVAIEGLTGTTSPGILNVLSELHGTYRWNTRYIAMERFEAENYLKKQRRFWNQKKRGFFSQLFNLPTTNVNQDAVEMVEEADMALADISRGEMSFGYLTNTIILMNEDKDVLEKDANYFYKQLSAMGLKPRIETLNTVAAFLGSLPSHAHENVRRPLISTYNLADLIPVYSMWIGSERNPCDKAGYKDAPALMYCVTGQVKNTPFRLNLHVKDIAHTMILGPTGAGKSTLLCTLAAQALRYKGMNVISFDKGKSMYALCLACEGKHFTPGGDKKLNFCPLQEMKDPMELAWAQNWITDIIELNNVQVTPEMKKEVQDALKTMMEMAINNPNTSLTLTLFSSMVQDERIRTIFETYTISGAQGKLLDSDQDGLGEFGPFTVFEIEDLMNLKESFALPVLTYLFHRIEKNLKGQPCLLLLDEAWIMLGHSVFRAKIKEWLKVLRKRNCGVVLATQSLSDAANSGILDVLNESCLSKIFLPNPFAIQEDNAKLYKNMNLNEVQIGIIARGEQKRDYYYASPRNSREFQLALDPFQLAFVGVSDPADLAEVDHLINVYGKDWVDHWLKEKKVEWPANFHWVQPDPESLKLDLSHVNFDEEDDEDDDLNQQNGADAGGNYNEQGYSDANFGEVSA